MNQTVKLGVIGCGEIARQYHIPALLQTNNAEVIAVADPNKESVLKAKKQLNIRDEMVFDNAESLLKLSQLDGVLILTPTFTHLPLVKCAASQGKHIFCQKPLAQNVSDCVELIKVCEKSGSKLFVSFMQRYLPEVEQARKWLQQDYIGKVQTVRIRNSPGGAAALTKWIFNKDLVGGGAVMELGIHGIDLVRYLVGEIEQILYCRLDRLKEQVLVESESVAITAEDHALVIYQTNNKCLVSHEISLLQLPLAQRFSMEIYGEEGSIFIRNGKNPLTMCQRTPGGEEKWVTPKLCNSPFGIKQHQEFVNMILHNGKPNPSGYDGLRSLQIVEEIYRKSSLAN